jgi:integrase
MARRSYGTGSLIVRTDSTGRNTWHAKVWAGRRQVWRKLGEKRAPGSRDGLTRTQAEARLRRLIEELERTPVVVERLTVEDVGRRYVKHLTTLGRRRSTLLDYESYLRVHLVPFFGDLPLEKIGRADVEDFVAEKLVDGKAPKSVRNYLGLLHSLFAYAEKQEWTRGNPCKLVEKPGDDDGDADIRFLDDEELDALLRAVADKRLGPLDRVLYLTAAMTGLRQGELLGLRWRDIDWAAARVRVRQSYVRGEFGRPKSKRSTRSVPLADRVAGELDRHFKASPFQADDDLVFGNPHTGKPLARRAVLKRFKNNLTRARVRETRFHDLRHTFGTRMAAAGVPLRTLQEWMGHRDFKTTLIYADYQPSEREAELVEKAFGRATHAQPETGRMTSR